MGGKTMRIYFTSDLHTYLFPTDYRSPGERDIGLFKCANRFHKDGNTLIIDGGDNLQGSPFGAFCHESVFKSGTIAQIMNRCGYDYVTLGNHDFNYGMDYLTGYLDALDAQCVCQNVKNDDGTPRFPYRIHVLENGLRVGIVGIVTDHVNVWERPEHLTGITITDPLSSARQALELMKGQVDVTVCVYHGGFERDLETGALLSSTTENVGWRICHELDFDLLLTGHQHMHVPGQTLCGTYVVQPMDFGKEFVELTATVDSSGVSFTSRHIPAGGDYDAALLREFAPVEQGAQDWLDAVVGHLDAPLTAAAPLNMAAKNNSLSDFFNMIQLHFSGAQLSATSLANEIVGLPQTVHRRDVLSAYPYTNTMAVIKITGSVLRQAMERSAEYFALDSSGQLCVSEQFLKPKVEHYNYDYYAGVDYVFDISRPVGQRVARLEYKGQEIADTDVFTMCLNSYRASGTGGYECYLGCPVVKEINYEMADLILEYFKEHPHVTVAPSSSFLVRK